MKRSSSKLHLIFWEYAAISGSAAQTAALSAFTTWEMSFQQLCSNDREKQEAVAYLLTAAAFLAPVPIKELIFAFRLGWIGSLPWWLRIFVIADKFDSTKPWIQITRRRGVGKHGFDEHGHYTAYARKLQEGDIDNKDENVDVVIWDCDRF